ncbi:hypothetical protein, conserved in P.knowlesi [Plasmodium knowlesi strain H]|uniref:Uncharacterized protein n=3 Tax=Plasmodium knowlesi TaxID=5850 RepID=A0A5K1V7G3_PLAKH|nr:uncharacterized protein PKNH_1000500 [Plasmodium knowlesi strain H]OTN67176.1 Uncharacterized protein PKNOH_S07438100 [Plasmodium knowlesi]CAA9988516.1 hypothetical protein, conserved in P.knowlesi [Plasmodium knowlesi strain H]SBO21281.1 hypothetical protein, conserved in P.knowlesi [Plasmodium knowlesi strain H]SBO21734.1 hypothetical protein, conserved in P.knowlesi [Plasmodium knowlesi strain H]VVS77990.1 hypothetical protein, conserved in P.knowlesi [Plasmodium knowlesi strain H]|eukprot:XP_002259491.1 [Plasmodium knowlesi strain H]
MAPFFFIKTSTLIFAYLLLWYQTNYHHQVSALSTLNDNYATSMESLFTKMQKTRFPHYSDDLSTNYDTSVESLFTKMQKTRFPHYSDDLSTNYDTSMESLFPQMRDVHHDDHDYFHHNGRYDHHDDGYGGHNDSMSTLSSSVDTIFKKEGIRTNYNASYKAPHKTLYETLHKVPYKAPHEFSYRAPHEFSYKASREVPFRAPHKTLFDAPHMARYGRMKIRPRGFFNKLLYNIEKIKRTGALLSPKVIRISLLYILALFCIGLIVVLSIGPQAPFAWTTCGIAISVFIACIYSSVRIGIK